MLTKCIKANERKMREELAALKAKMVEQEQELLKREEIIKQKELRLASQTKEVEAKVAATRLQLEGCCDIYIHWCQCQ